MSEFTKEQIEQYEKDIKDGKQIDIKNYLNIKSIKYNNTLSNIFSSLSENISKIVMSGVEGTFKYISKFVTE